MQHLTMRIYCIKNLLTSQIVIYEAVCSIPNAPCHHSPTIPIMSFNLLWLDGSFTAQYLEKTKRDPMVMSRLLTHFYLFPKCNTMRSFGHISWCWSVLWTVSVFFRVYYAHCQIQILVLVNVWLFMSDSQSDFAWYFSFCPFSLHLSNVGRSVLDAVAYSDVTRCHRCRVGNVSFFVSWCLVTHGKL